MNILIIGSGGREHALGWKIAQSNKMNKLFFAPGNAGTSEIGTNLNAGVSDFEKIKSVVLENQIDLIEEELFGFNSLLFDQQNEIKKRLRSYQKAYEESLKVNNQI